MNDTNFLRRLWEQLNSQAETPPPPPKAPGPVAEIYAEYSYLSDNGIVVERITTAADAAVTSRVDAVNDVLARVAKRLQTDPATAIYNSVACDVVFFERVGEHSRLLGLVPFRRTWVALETGVMDVLRRLTEESSSE